MVPLADFLFTSFVSVLGVLVPFSRDPIKHQSVNFFRKVSKLCTNMSQTGKLLTRELIPPLQTASLTAQLTASGHNF